MSLISKSARVLANHKPEKLLARRRIFKQDSQFRDQISLLIPCLAEPPRVQFVRITRGYWVMAKESQLGVP